MKKLYYSPILFIVIFAVFLIAFELYNERKNYYFIMKERAHEIVKTVITFRDWAANANHLYADAEKIKPNAFLAWRSDRDINADGLHLTMVNPAYMTRLVSVLLNKNDGFRLHIVGIRAINKQNSPSSWEKEGFDAFLRGEKDYAQPVTSGLKKMSFRYMQPLYVKKQCLSCHYREHFKVGELIGGISIEMPPDNVAVVLYQETMLNICIFIIITVIMIITIFGMQKKIFSTNTELKKTITDLNKEIKKREISEKALIRQTRKATQGELLSLVSHHWRQPLNAISLTLDLMRLQLEENDVNDEETNLYIDQSQKMIQDLSHSIDMFRKKYRDDSDEFFSVTKSTMDVVSMVEQVLSSNGIKLTVKCIANDDTGKPCTCSGDVKGEKKCPFENIMLKGSNDEFRQILLAIMKNSYEAIMEMHKEGGTRQGMITVNVIFKDKMVHISIIDNGIGMSEEAAEKAFEAYYTTKGYEFGKGTGLYFAKNLTEKFKMSDIAIIRHSEQTEVIFTAGTE